MKKKIKMLFTISCLLLIIASCKKDRTEAIIAEVDITNSIANAKASFENQSKITQTDYSGQSVLPENLLKSRKPLWDHAFTQKNGDTIAVFVPLEISAKLTLMEGGVKGTYLNDLIFLRLMSIGNDFDGSKAEMITLFPDKIWEQEERFSGIMFGENWFKPSLFTINSGKENNRKIGANVVNGFKPCETANIMVCIGAGGYTTCEPSIVRSCSGGGGEGGGGGAGGIGTPGGGKTTGAGGGSNGGSGGNGAPIISNSEVTTSVFVNDARPKISDIKKYTKCFNDGKEAKSYSMTIYVDQPVAGKSNWARITMIQPNVSSNNSYGVPTGINWTTPGGQTFDVGHTFVSFEKNNADGTNVRQILGFYPSGNPLVSKGAMEDNGGHEADVSYKFNVTKEQFQAALNKVESDFLTKDYVLTNSLSNEYNCTDAAISWANAAGVSFGNTTMGLFNNTPGNFGQVLRTKEGANLNPDKNIFGKGPCN